MRRRIGLIRFLLEAAFVALVAAAVAFADLSWIWIAVVLGAWVLLVIVERSESRSRVVEAEAPEPEGHVVTEPEPEPDPEPERKVAPVLVAAPSPPEPPPAAEPTAPTRAWRRRARDRRDEPVVRLQLPQAPREWNIWELERLASATRGDDPAQDQERALLVMSLRQFADPSGELPVDFDSLVREAFEPELLAGLAPRA